MSSVKRSNTKCSPNTVIRNNSESPNTNHDQMLEKVKKAMERGKKNRLNLITMARMRGSDMKEIAVNIISGVVRKELSTMNTNDDQLPDDYAILSDDSNENIIMKSDSECIEKDPDDMDDIELKEYLGEESLYLLMEEVLKSLNREEIHDEFIEHLYEYNIDSDLSAFNFDDIDNDTSIVCPFCQRCNMRIFENEGYGQCAGCGIHISLYSSRHNRNMSLVELRSCLADFFDHHGSGNCCNFDNVMGISHLQITCLKNNVHVTCLACRFSSDLLN